MNRIMINFLKRFYWDLSNKAERQLYTEFFLRYLPAHSGILLRRKYYCKKFQKSGESVNILAGIFIVHPERIECGNNMSFGIANYIQAGGGLKIGHNVMFGPYVKIWTQTHNFERKNIPMREQGYSYNPVEIGDNVWIGANSFLMPGVKIESNSIISACSVVGAKSYPEGIILAGNPARKIGQR